MELLIGDPHLKINDYEKADKLLSWISGLVEEKRPDKVIFLGDTFHTHAVIRSEIMKLVYNSIRKISQKSQVIMIVGNHDLNSANNPTSHSLEVFKHLSNIQVVDTPSIVDNDLYVPYLHHSEAFMEACNLNKNYQRIFAHQLFLGANMGFITSSEGVKCSDLNEQVKIFSGHIHKKQILNQVTYVGTPYASESSDADEVKGVHLLKGNDLSFVVSPFPQIKTLKIPVEQVEKTLSNLDKNHEWVITIQGSSKEIDQSMMNKEVKKLKGGLSLTIKRETQKVSLTSEKKGGCYSLEETLEEYVNNIETTLDKTILCKMCKEFLSE